MIVLLTMGLLAPGTEYAHSRRFTNLGLTAPSSVKEFGEELGKPKDKSGELTGERDTTVPRRRVQ